MNNSPKPYIPSCLKWHAELNVHALAKNRNLEEFEKYPINEKIGGSKIREIVRCAIRKRGLIINVNYGNTITKIETWQNFE